MILFYHLFQRCESTLKQEWMFAQERFTYQRACERRI